MTNNTLYDLFTFGSHTGSHLELWSYASFYRQKLLFYGDMANLRDMANLSTIMIFHYL